MVGFLSRIPAASMTTDPPQSICPSCQSANAFPAGSLTDGSYLVHVEVDGDSGFEVWPQALICKDCGLVRLVVEPAELEDLMAMEVEALHTLPEEPIPAGTRCESAAWVVGLMLSGAIVVALLMLTAHMLSTLIS